MSVSFMSIISFLLSFLSMFALFFATGSTGTANEIGTIFLYIGIVLGLVFPILAKIHRKKHDLLGRGLEIAALIIDFYILPFLPIFTYVQTDFIPFFLFLVPCIIYIRLSYRKIPTAKADSVGVEHKKSWLLRPVAWILTILMMLALQFLAELLCRFGEYVFLWLNSLSTVAIVLLSVTFGGTFLGLFTYSAIILPSLVVTISDKLYPSNHAFRYYFVGIYEVIGCSLLVFAAMMGAVSGGSMFWFYVRYIWLIAAAIVMMIIGRNASNERHK